jgi:hypothetical protein
MERFAVKVLRSRFGGRRLVEWGCVVGRPSHDPERRVGASAFAEPATAGKATARRAAADNLGGGGPPSHKATEDKAARREEGTTASGDAEKNSGQAADGGIPRDDTGHRALQPGSGGERGAPAAAAHREVRPPNGGDSYR